jgi:hypothetical protein
MKLTLFVCRCRRRNSGLVVVGTARANLRIHSAESDMIRKLTLSSAP